MSSPSLKQPWLKPLLSVCILSLLAGLPAAQAKDAGSRNYQATRAYYTQLVSGDTPKLAELDLLMTMLPKGGDIHHHYTGALYAETYIDWLGAQGYCVYRDNDPAKKQQQFRVNTTPGGAGPDCLKADAIRADNQFYRQLLMRWSDKDFANHSHQQNPPDQQFFDTFGYFGPVSGFSTNQGLRILKQQAKAENLQYIETMLKGSPAVDNAALAAAIDALSPDASQAEVDAALTPFYDFLSRDAGTKKQVADYVAMIEGDAAGIDDADFTMRYQSYVVRLLPPAKVFSMLYTAFSSAQSSKLIVGVNIVGAENTIVSMRDYKLHMKMFHFLKQRFAQVHLDLHAGELAVGMVPPAGLQFHIRDAVETAGAERIGHGVDITHEADAVQLLAQLAARKIAVEINLSSNAFILGVEGAAHPVSVYLQHAVPIVISSDDAGVSRNQLSGEYVLFASRYRPSYDTLKSVAYNSIRYSFLSAADKAAQLRILDRRFARFEAEVAKLAKSQGWAVKAGARN